MINLQQVGVLDNFPKCMFRNKPAGLPEQSRPPLSLLSRKNDYYREVKTGQGPVCEAPPSEIYGLPVFSTA